jgi:chemotaxis family two-component system response regulator PixG
MPNTNGYEICIQLRKVSAFRETPIIILTGNDGIIDRVRAKVVGATDFLGKPVDAETVLAVANKYLKHLKPSSIVVG